MQYDARGCLFNMTSSPSRKGGQLPHMTPLDPPLETSAKEVEIMLTPSDIPGADPSEPFDKQTVSQLRWWLLCW